jgi:predicted lipoprotein with Yx(FWY)xxD motif
MTRSFSMLAAVGLLALVLLAAACGGGSATAGGLYGNGNSPSAAPTTAPAATTAAAKVGVSSSGLGHIVVNGSRRTLYIFEKDTNGMSSCNGACAAYWPPLVTNGKPVALAGVNQSLVGTTKRADGSEQVTYNGWPVYTFIGDKQPGQTSGEGLTDFGAGWDALTPAGAKVEADGSSASAATQSGGGW